MMSEHRAPSDNQRFGRQVVIIWHRDAVSWCSSAISKAIARAGCRGGHFPGPPSKQRAQTQVGVSLCQLGRVGYSQTWGFCAHQTFPGGGEGGYPMPSWPVVDPSRTGGWFVNADQDDRFAIALKMIKWKSHCNDCRRIKNLDLVRPENFQALES